MCEGERKGLGDLRTDQGQNVRIGVRMQLKTATLVMYDVQNSEELYRGLLKYSSIEAAYAA